LSINGKSITRSLDAVSQPGRAVPKRKRSRGETALIPWVAVRAAFPKFLDKMKQERHAIRKLKAHRGAGSKNGESMASVSFAQRSSRPMLLGYVSAKLQPLVAQLGKRCMDTRRVVLCRVIETLAEVPGGPAASSQSGDRGHGHGSRHGIRGRPGSPGPFSVAELQNKCPNVSMDMIRRVLKNLRTKNQIECLGRGENARWQKTVKWQLGNTE